MDKNKTNAQAPLAFCSRRGAARTTIPRMAENHSNEGQAEGIEVRERGGGREGAPTFLERRLFMQLLVFESDRKLAPADAAKNLAAALVRRNVPSVVYEDVNNPDGVGGVGRQER